MQTKIWQSLGLSLFGFVFSLLAHAQLECVDGQPCRPHGHYKASHCKVKPFVKDGRLEIQIQSANRDAADGLSLTEPLEKIEAAYQKKADEGWCQGGLFSDDGLMNMQGKLQYAAIDTYCTSKKYRRVFKKRAAEIPDNLTTCRDPNYQESQAAAPNETKDKK